LVEERVHPNPSSRQQGNGRGPTTEWRRRRLGDRREDGEDRDEDEEG